MRIISKILGILGLFAEDIFILLGVGFIVKAAFIVNEALGYCILGLFLLIFGVILSQKPPKMAPKQVKTSEKEVKTG